MALKAASTKPPTRIAFIWFPQEGRTDDSIMFLGTPPYKPGDSLG
jgi:hypothetical protein